MPLDTDSGHLLLMPDQLPCSTSLFLGNFCGRIKIPVPPFSYQTAEAIYPLKLGISHSSLILEERNGGRLLEAGGETCLKKSSRVSDSLSDHLIAETKISQ